jgi:hypothetical protein
MVRVAVALVGGDEYAAATEVGEPRPPVVIRLVRHAFASVT